MNLKADNFIQRTPQSISVVFVILAICLQVSLAFYWLNILQPKLKDEAAANAKIIAQSQSSQLLDVLQNAQLDDDMEPVESMLDQLLLYQEPGTGLPFFKQISLELDTSLYSDNANILRGQEVCNTCFEVDVALFSPETFEILGIAHFEVSDEFFKNLSRQVQAQIITVGVITIILLALAWLTSLLLIRSLKKEMHLRKASEEALEENREKYHRLVSSLNQYFVYTRTPTGDLNYSSEAVKQLYGFEPHEMSDLSRHLTNNPINKVARHYLNKPSSEESQVEFEIEIKDKAGESRWLMLSEINLFDQANNLTNVEGLARDITKQKQVEKALVAAKEEAEIASKAKGQFLANMSHEIRTPMNAIIGNCYLMQKTPLSIKQQQFVKRIDSSAHVLLGLVNDVLDLSKIEAGKMELENIPFQLDEVLENLSNVVINAAQNKGLDIIFDVEPGIEQGLIGDPLRLGQVILNLVNNAIKFTEKGEILLRIRSLGQRGDKINFQFAIKDDGIGIQESKQKMLFQSFNQVDSSMTRKFGGTGLGLAICQHLVHMMKGNIGVQSEYGKGSTFTFNAEFGLSTEASVQKVTLFEQDAHDHVLVVDDSHTSASILGNLLGHLGIQAALAHSGEHALELLNEKAASHPFSTVFLDLRMPGLNGIETAAKIHSQMASGTIPTLILITAHGLSDLDSEEIENFFATMIQKPVTESSLVNCLNSTGKNLDNLPQPPTESTEKSDGDFSEKSVLLVEDNLINQEVANALLEDVKIDAFIANNGLEAIDMLKKRSFDIILMDIQMPVMDGLTASRKIRQELKLETPIIAMTAHAMEEDRQASEQAGMSDYLTKPIEVDAFYAMLNKWLATGRTEPHADTAESESVVSSDIIEGIDLPSALKRVANKQALLDKLLNEFAVHYSDFSTRMLQHVKDGAEQEQLSVLHKLKGESGNISAYQVHEIASLLEDYLRQGNPLNERHIEQLGLALKHLLNNINAYLSTKINQNKEHAIESEQTAGEKVELDDSAKADLKNTINTLNQYFEDNALHAVDVGDELIRKYGLHFDRELTQDFSSALNQLDYELANEILQKLSQAIDQE